MRRGTFRAQLAPCVRYRRAHVRRGVARIAAVAGRKNAGRPAFRPTVGGRERAALRLRRAIALRTPVQAVAKAEPECFQGHDRQFGQCRHKSAAASPRPPGPCSPGTANVSRRSADCRNGTSGFTVTAGDEIGAHARVGGHPQAPGRLDPCAQHRAACRIDQTLVVLEPFCRRRSPPSP